MRVLLSAQTGAGMPVAFRFDAQQSPRVISDLLPALERAGTVTLDGALAERIIRRPLKVRAYFDRDNNLVLCKIAFLYGDEEIDPFAAQTPQSETRSAFCSCAMRRQSGVRLTCWRRLVSACRKGASSSAVRSLFIAS